MAFHTGFLVGMLRHNAELVLATERKLFVPIPEDMPKQCC